MKSALSLIATVALSGLGVAWTAPSVADTVVKIGHAGPLTGSQAQSGKDDERGVQLAINELNARKMVIDGQPVTFQLISADDQADPKVGVNVAQQLIDAGVVAVIGHYNSGVSIPAARVYNDAHVVMITGASSNPALTALGFPYVFRLATNDNEMGVRMADYAAKTLKVKRVAVVDDRTAYGSGVADVFIKQATKDGLTVVAREYGTDKSTDFKGILTHVKAANPQVVFYGGYYAQAAFLARQMNDLGMKAALVGGDGICSPEFATLSNNALDGRMFCAQGGEPLDSLPAGKAFREKFRSTFNAEVDTYSPAFYAATLLVADAMQKANSTSAPVFSKVMSDASFSSMLGPVKFDPQGDWVHAPVTVYRLTRSKLEPLAAQ
ncbi:branched-chain amino acid ABC transporter substrate-binding protein [Paraburkholderia sp. BCC1886]|uniref:branched-chain amino acid ABC transporter substrate-binding protein n=1 Tax=Paraburkholderia sp. BCC1886 TaxID=2562670 RepID=UPI001182374F|nr:branched-chain amino acid ABC transporter substrate-binding protein [Paraburkholderia sp. BCC1886]